MGRDASLVRMEGTRGWKKRVAGGKVGRRPLVGEDPLFRAHVVGRDASPSKNGRDTRLEETCCWR